MVKEEQAIREMRAIVSELSQQPLNHRIHSDNWSDQQISLIGSVGIQSWLARQMTPGEVE